VSLQRFLHDWAIPAAIGLAVAAVLLFAFPHLRGFQPTAVSPQSFQAPVSYARAVNLAGPAVVNIYTRKHDPLASEAPSRNPIIRRLQRLRSQPTLGSGVIVDEQGYILTNHHVTAGAEQIAVVLADGREALAKPVGSDSNFDLAVLKIDLSELTAIEVGDPENAQVGDVVLAIGNPWGVGQSVTQGIISATGRDLSFASGGSYLQNFLQTDAAVNPGNSGGALVDTYGKLLGINTTILDQKGSAAGISFAIPANIALKVMRDLIEYGRVVPGWLGIEASEVNPRLARAFKLPSTNGVIITAIYNGGPAFVAGLKPGDVIIQINDDPINDGNHGIAAMATLKPGETVTITYIRNGQAYTTEATVSEQPQSLLQPQGQE